MNKAIGFLILLSFLALGGVAFFYYFYYEGNEETVGTFVKVPEVLNYKTLIAQNKSEATELELNEHVGDGWCDDFFNVAEYEYDHGDCCQPAINVATCTRCECHKNPNKCPNINLIGDGFCQTVMNNEKCSFDGGDCCESFILLRPI